MNIWFVFTFCKSITFRLITWYLDSLQTGRGRRRWKALHLSSDENQLKIQNLSGVAKKLATYVMSLWPGMMVACNVFHEKWKCCADPILPTNMGDASASLLEDEDCQCTRGCQRPRQILKKQFCGRKVLPKNELLYLIAEAWMYHIVIGNNPLSMLTKSRKL